MQTSKKVYIGLLGISLLLAVLLSCTGWYLITNRHLIVNQVLLISIVVFLVGLAVILSAGILALVFMIKRSKNIPLLDKLIRLVNEILFPLTLVTGKIFGIKREKILRSFIEVNNHIVGLKRLFLSKDQIMILLPHCLQNAACQYKITIDVNNCHSCGKCKIGELKKFAEENRALLKVVTGGTLARKYIIENRPKGIIAVACERDLSSGIQDSGKIPVLGVLNRFTKGPCIDTDVDMKKVENAFHVMCEGG